MACSECDIIGAARSGRSFAVAICRASFTDLRSAFTKGYSSGFADKRKDTCTI
jgi:hypothetical protein